MAINIRPVIIENIVWLLDLVVNNMGYELLSRCRFHVQRLVRNARGDRIVTCFGINTIILQYTGVIFDIWDAVN